MVSNVISGRHHDSQTCSHDQQLTFHLHSANTHLFHNRKFQSLHTDIVKPVYNESIRYDGFNSDVLDVWITMFSVNVLFNVTLTVNRGIRYPGIDGGEFVGLTDKPPFEQK